MLNGFKSEKLFTFELLESIVRTEWPSGIAPIADTDMYIAKKIKIVGTQNSPEVFTTNVGKLLYNFGTTAFPSISLLSYNVAIFCNSTPYQDAKVNQVGDVTQSGSNISFQLAVSDTGNASGDTFFYADITIALQAII